MPTSRREFLATSTAAFAGLAASPLLGTLAEPTPEKLKILILGGTAFLGPPTVERALARGHDVTLFNRGKTNPHLFPDVEKLRGDRMGDISALEGREWDVVVDNFAYIPRVVQASTELLAPNVKQMILISTLSVYADVSVPGLTEDHPLAPIDAETEESVTEMNQVMAHYGSLKARCEETAEQVMPGRVANIRPGLIVGPGDWTGRFTYWPWRVARGGEVLAPGEPGHFNQVIDVRDLADFIVLSAEQNTVGVYNAVTPAATMTIGSMLEACKQATGSDATFTWADAEFLMTNGCRPYQQMPCWIPPTMDGYAGAGQVSTKRAMAAGLTTRPIGETAKAALDWYNGLPEDHRAKQRAFGEPGMPGLTPEREAEVLKLWHEWVD